MDFYVILGLHREATLGEVKRAYRRLARKYHPDINPGDRRAAAQFKDIAEAYAVLSDPERRRYYDLNGRVVTVSADGTGFEGFDFSIAVSGDQAPTFGDLFADVLMPREAPEQGPERGADLHQTLPLSFVEAFHGGERSVTMTRQERCGVCEGVGVLRSGETRCLHCRGTGRVKATRGHMVFTRPCLPCGGGGWRQTRCAGCLGQGLQVRTDEVKVHVPAGLANGARVRVQGQGQAGRRGGEPGDLYLTVQVEPDPLFRREGDDLHLIVPVAVHEAALGARIEVPALDGVARVRIPPGTQSGDRIRVHERGVPSPRRDRRGDLVVEVKLVLPPALDERSKSLLREFGTLNGEDVRRDLRSRG